MSFSRTASRYFLLLATILLFATVAIRIVGLLDMPLGSDEARHIVRAHAITRGQIFAGLDQNKWLYGVVLALFDATGSEGSWIARYVSVLWSAVTVSACIRLGWLLKDKPLGLLAGWMYTFLPLAFFLERTSLVDPQTTALSTLALVFMITFARSQSLRDGVLLMLMLLLARLTKPSMILYFALPTVAYVLFRVLQPGGVKRFNLIQAVIVLTQVTFIPIVLTTAVYMIAAMNGIRPEETHQLSLGNTVLGSDGNLLDVLPRFLTDLGLLGQRAVSLVSAMVLIGVLLAIVWLMLRSVYWRALIFLLLPAVVFLAVPLLAERPATGLPPRYLMLSGPPLVVLAAFGLLGLLERIPQGSRSTVLAVILIASAGQLLTFRTTPLEVPDIAVFQREAAEAVRQDAGASFDQQPVTVITTGNTWELSAYLGSRVNRVVWFTADRRPELHLQAVEGQTMYLVESAQVEPFPGSYEDGFQLERIASHEGVTGVSNVYRVGSFQGDFAQRLYNNRVDAPAELVEFYQVLEANPITEPVYVFPREHFEWYTEFSQYDVRYLNLETWPLNQAAIDTVLFPLAEEPQVSMLLVDSAKLDPTNQLMTALQTQHLYQISDAWAGPLQLMQFATGPSGPDMQQIDTVFEEAITIESAVVLNAERADTLLIRLHWRTNQPIADSFTVFTHVLSDDGELVAQRDRLPGNGLYPTDSWATDAVIVDQFALQLPSDLASGSYQVIAGLYNRDSGLRLQVSSANAQLPDAAVIGMIGQE